jgi:hypothetical protein
MYAGRKVIKILLVGIDTHQSMYQVEVHNDGKKERWRGHIGNNRKGFEDLLLKLRTLEMSNNDSTKGYT